MTVICNKKSLINDIQIHLKKAHFNAVVLFTPFVQQIDLNKLNTKSIVRKYSIKTKISIIYTS